MGFSLREGRAPASRTARRPFSGDSPVRLFPPSGSYWGRTTPATQHVTGVFTVAQGA